MGQGRKGGEVSGPLSAHRSQRLGCRPHPPLQVRGRDNHLLLVDARVGTEIVEVPESSVDHDHVGIDPQPDRVPQVGRRIGNGCSTNAGVIMGELMSGWEGVWGGGRE